MRTLLLFLLFATAVSAQNEPLAGEKPRDNNEAPSRVLRFFERAIVWEGVRIRTETVFGETNIGPSFKIKSDKDKRRELVAALEGQFQVNISESDIRSLKRAEDLTDYIFRAQQGIVMFSKTGFQGKVERLLSDRKDCDEHFDCLNFIGSLIVPKGFTVTLFSEPKFKGEQLLIDAGKEEVRIASFLSLVFEGPVSTTNKALNWREDVRSIRVKGLE